VNIFPVFTGLLSDAGEGDLLHRFINASDLAEQVTSMRLVIVISLIFAFHALLCLRRLSINQSSFID